MISELSAESPRHAAAVHPIPALWENSSSKDGGQARVDIKMNAS